jgi:hypothetical protein
LQRDRQAAFEGVLRAEPALDGVVEIDAAGLQLGADRIVDAAGRAVLDLVPQFQQENQVVLGALFDGTPRVLKALG